MYIFVSNDKASTSVGAPFKRRDVAMFFCQEHLSASRLYKVVVCLMKIRCSLEHSS